MTESKKAILSILDGTRIKLRRLNLVLAAGILLSLAGAALLMVTPLIKWGGIDGAWGIFAAFIKIAALAGIVYAVGRWFVKGIFFGPDRRGAALKIENTVPGLNNDLVVSLDLIEAPPVSKNMYSPELAGAHIDSAAERLSGLDCSPALPYRAAKRATGSAAAVAVAATTMILLLPVPSRQAAAYLLGPHLLPGNSSELKNAEQPLPLGDFEIKYDYPAYTGWESKVVGGTDGSLRAIKGTVATVRARSVYPLQSVNFQMENVAIPASLPNSNTVEGKLTMVQPGRYRVTALGAKGENFVESSAHTIEIVPDSAPEVEITSPAEDREVDEAGVLPIQFGSKDDFGVKEVAIVYSVNGKEGRITVVNPEPGQREVSGTYTWDMAALDLMPGDEVRYFLQALDNDEVSGPKPGNSKTWKLSIFSPRKEHNRLVDLEWQLLDRMVAVLGDTLVRKPLPDGEVADEALKPDRLIAEGLDDLVKRIDEINEGLKNDKLADLNTYTLLDNIKQDLKGLLARRREILDRENPSEQALVKRQAAETPSLESHIIALDNELERQKVAEVMSRAEDLLDAQRRVSDLLSKAQAGDENAKAALEKEIARMQELMKDLLEALSRSKGNLPDDFMNVEALKNMPLNESMDAFEKMRQAIENGDLDAAMKMAQDMQNLFAQMMSAMESGAMNFGMGRSGEALQKLSDFRERIDKLKERQQKLFDETQNIGVQAQQDMLDKQKAQQEKARKKLEELMAELKKTADDAQERLKVIEPVDPKSLSRADFINIHRNISSVLYNMIRYNLKKADQYLEAWKLFDLLGVMQAILNDTQIIKNGSMAILNMDLADPKESRAIAEGSERMVAISNEMIDILKKLLEPPNRKLSAEDMERLMEMAREQAQLGKDAEALQGEMEEFRKDFPMMSPENAQKVGEASEAMGDAGNRLGKSDPNGALSPEALALRKLSEAADSMKSLQERIMQGAMGMPMPMPTPSPMGSGSGMGNRNGWQLPGMFYPGEVEIPGREGYKVPEKFRGDILRAMQHNAPEQYKRLNRDYYKKLIE